ncbi:glycosyltransferase family 39 protein [Candidatus Daviesbacteria bacterium]|nr:glycosyltransferase family 39 protein [Candidatus Daviesbacteria bacterium]
MKKTFFVLASITILSLLPFFNSQFFYTQDHIFIARLQQMSTALSDGHFPVRWAPDLRFGEPLFNFYAPLPYYLGAMIKLFGFNYIWVAKILFILSSFLSAITMYIFCRQLFSGRAAFLAAALYVWAPYRAVDLYVRGALSEAFAFIFFPLIFYTALLLSQKVSWPRLSFLSLSLAGLFLTHNVTTLIFLPFFTAWLGYLIWQRANLKLIFPFLGAIILSAGLASFFLLPAIFEREFIQTKYLLVGYFDFRAHFVAFYQFFSPVWGYGASLWGPIDDMSFQVGLVNWLILILSLGLGFILRQNKKLLIFPGFLFFLFFLSIFLQHNKSAFVWEAIPLMAFIQFPWRFLAISIFIVSILGGVLAEHLKNKLFYAALFILTIGLNIQFFQPRNFVEDSFFDKFLNADSMHRGMDLTKDYFPIWVKFDRVEYFPTPRANSGEIEVSSFEKKTGRAVGEITVLSESEIEVPITYFPGWEVKAGGERINLSEPSLQGLITFKLPPGEYQIDLALKNTPVRMVGNVISLISFLLVLGFYVKFHKIA